MNNLVDRLKEPSSYAGLSGIFIGIGTILKGDLGIGIPMLVTSLLAVFVPEKKAS